MGVLVHRLAVCAGLLGRTNPSARNNVGCGSDSDLMSDGPGTAVSGPIPVHARRRTGQRLRGASGGGPGCRTDRAAPRAADYGVLARSPATGRGASVRSGRARSGARSDLRARRLAHPAVRRPQHPVQAPRVDRAPRRAVRTQARSAATRASHRRHRARRKVQFDCFVGRLLDTKGTVWQYTATTSPPLSRRPSCTLKSASRARGTPRARSPRRRRARRRRLETSRGDHRQRLGAPRQRLRRRRRTGRRPPALHPRRPAQLERLRERVQLIILEQRWRPAFARSLVPKRARPGPRPRRIPQRLRVRPRQHWAPHPARVPTGNRSTVPTK
jgi:hypothetical protein